MEPIDRFHSIPRCHFDFICVSIMGRSPPFSESDGLRRGSWDAEEDRILVSYISKHGHSNWKTLPQLAGLQRCGKSCRLRWLNYLRPGIKRGNFTREEEDAIIQLHQMLGNRWSVIAARLPGRTDNEIKNVWHTHLKKRMARDSAANSAPVSRNSQALKRGGGGSGSGYTASGSDHVTSTAPSSTVMAPSCHSSSSASTLASPSSVTSASPALVEMGAPEGEECLPWLGGREGGVWASENYVQRIDSEEDAGDFWRRLLMEVEAFPDSHQQLPIDHLLFMT